MGLPHACTAMRALCCHCDAQARPESKQTPFKISRAVASASFDDVIPGAAAQSARSPAGCGFDANGLIKSAVFARLDRAIQYAEAYRLKHCCLWNTGSPASAGDDQCAMGSIPSTTRHCLSLIGGATFSAGAGGSTGVAPAFCASGSGRAGSGAGFVGRVPPGFDSAGISFCGSGVADGVDCVACASCAGGLDLISAIETATIAVPAAISVAAISQSLFRPSFRSSADI